MKNFNIATSMKEAFFEGFLTMRREALDFTNLPLLTVQEAWEESCAKMFCDNLLKEE